MHTACGRLNYILVSPVTGMTATTLALVSLLLPHAHAEAGTRNATWFGLARRGFCGLTNASTVASMRRHPLTRSTNSSCATAYCGLAHADLHQVCGCASRFPAAGVYPLRLRQWAACSGELHLTSVADRANSTHPWAKGWQRTNGSSFGKLSSERLFSLTRVSNGELVGGMPLRMSAPELRRFRESDQPECLAPSCLLKQVANPNPNPNTLTLTPHNPDPSPNSNPNPDPNPNPNPNPNPKTPLPSLGLALGDSVADASQPLFAEIIAVGGGGAALAVARNKTEVRPTLTITLTLDLTLDLTLGLALGPTVGLAPGLTLT